MQLGYRFTLQNLNTVYICPREGKPMVDMFVIVKCIKKNLILYTMWFWHNFYKTQVLSRWIEVLFGEAAKIWLLVSRQSERSVFQNSYALCSPTGASKVIKLPLNIKSKNSNWNFRGPNCERLALHVQLFYFTKLNFQQSHLTPLVSLWDASHAIAPHQDVQQQVFWFVQDHHAHLRFYGRFLDHQKIRRKWKVSDLRH